MSQAKIPTIGLILNDTSSSYQIAVEAGVREACEEFGVNFICFAVGELDSPNVWLQGNKELLKLIRGENVDGVVVASPVFSNWLSTNDMTDFFRSFIGVKVISIGTVVSGFPAIITENGLGMRQAIEHLVQTHGVRKPIFIGGAVASPEAVERLEFFEAYLSEQKIPWDRNTHYRCGHWSIPGAHRALADMLGDKIEFDAVVAANDDMAIGAIAFLRERGVRVPEDILVTGFDDSEAASLVNPTLSTVRQLMNRQGRRAVEILLDMIGGLYSKAEAELVPADFIPRFSCGCRAHEMKEAWELEPPSSFGEPGNEPNESAYQKILAHAPLGLDSKDPERLIQCLKMQVEEEGFEQTLQVVDANIRQILEKGRNPWEMQSYLTHLRLEAHRYLARDPKTMLRLETLLHLARLEVSKACVQVQAQEQVYHDRKLNAFSQLSATLINSFDLEVLVTTLRRGLLSLNINAAYLVMLQRSVEGDTNRLLFAMENREDIPMPAEGEIIPSGRLLPERLTHGSRKSLVVEPLSFLNHHLGHMLMEFKADLSMLYDPLRIQLSAALEGYRLMRQVRTSTEEAHQAYESLQRNQQQLLLSEKMASLGRLTAGIAHEMNTPLSAVRSSVEQIHSLVEEYSAAIGDRDVTDDDHRAIVADLRKALDIAKRAGDKAGGFVRSIKSQTRDMGIRDSQIFDAAVVVEDAILLVNHALRAAQIVSVLEIKAKPLLVKGIPDRLAQVVTNLITNSIDALEGIPGGKITISLEMNGTHVIFKVSDNGCGIPEENRLRIFDPLFTTKPVGKGTGLGLTIIHDIVESDFSGTIELASTETEGTTFTVRLPKAERK